ncbi:hypothetical protein RDI58_017742 [Solanum bulbocastanum]|uniref:Uncharacterized protein n=1 Tax=Solanum bulbocastanum TaxID=147425 RepID=A0AAN8YCA7_SOLBU
MFEKMSSNGNVALQWKNMRNLIRAQTTDKYSSQHAALDQFMFLFKITGSTLVPIQEDFTAKYLVQQYVAACGGQAALNSINSMSTVGQVRMSTSDMHQCGSNDNSKCHCEELMVRLLGVNLPLALVLQKVLQDPLEGFFKSIANLFLNAICFGEKTIKDEECFVLKLESSIEMLKAQSTTNTEVVHHTIWGCFNQRTGLLVQFEDTKLVRLKYIEGINVAYSVKTTATIYRYGKNIYYRAKIEETWFIEEIDCNIFGLSMECFLPHTYVNKETEFEDQAIAR